MAVETAEDKGHTLLISGIPVTFPYKPYPSQLAYMSKVVATLRATDGESQANALLEAPTGSGKTLSLLCAALAWQKHVKDSLLVDRKKAAEFSSPLLQGGGFIIDDAAEEPSGDGRPAKKRKQQKDNGGREADVAEKPPRARIFYGTRTHSQISQVVRELRKTKYEVAMAILGSRKHYCTNKAVARKASMDEECKLLLKDRKKSCGHYHNVQKLRSHESLHAGGPLGVHDIEDLVALGHSVRACAYFTSRLMAQEADIVFCPYNYLLDPTIRQSMDVDLRGSVVILDEAHNIEDVAREAASFTLELDALEAVVLEIEELVSAEGVALDTYQPIQDVMQELLAWFQQRTSNLQADGQGSHHRVFMGDDILHELGAAGISPETFPILSDCIRKAVKAATDADPDTPHLSGRAGVVLSGLITTLGYMLSNDGAHIADYRIVVQRCARDAEGSKGSSGDWVCRLNLWCMSPVVAFADLGASARAIILTSGTLSPMSSFASELGVKFGTCMEGAHVVDVEKQVWAGVVSRGPSDAALNASYTSASSPLFQDEVGLSLLACCRVVPHGALAFFPSYKLLERLCARWKRTGLWDRLSAVKDIFVEVRGPEEQLDGMLSRFYRAVKRGASGPGPPPPPKRGSGGRGGPKAGPPGAARKGTEGGRSGALLLAVCRGKVSEGIDFADAFARAVILVGIPYPNVTDLQVKLKKQYNDQHCAAKGLVRGEEWYRQQAFRALNQAAGRCIRHRNDFGAIVLLDERFGGGASRHLSKWLRSSVRPPAPFEQSMQDLAAFFAALRVSPPGCIKAPERGQPHSCAPKLFPIFRTPVSAAARPERATSPVVSVASPKGSDHGSSSPPCASPLPPQVATEPRTQATAARHAATCFERLPSPGEAYRSPLRNVQNLPPSARPMGGRSTAPPTSYLPRHSPSCGPSRMSPCTEVPGRPLSQAPMQQGPRELGMGPCRTAGWDGATNATEGPADSWTCGGTAGAGRPLAAGQVSEVAAGAAKYKFSGRPGGGGVQGGEAEGGETPQGGPGWCSSLPIRPLPGAEEACPARQSVGGPHAAASAVSWQRPPQPDLGRRGSMHGLRSHRGHVPPPGGPFQSHPSGAAVVAPSTGSGAGGMGRCSLGSEEVMGGAAGGGPATPSPCMCGASERRCGDSCAFGALEHPWMDPSAKVPGGLPVPVDTGQRCAAQGEALSCGASGWGHPEGGTFRVNNVSQPGNMSGLVCGERLGVLMRPRQMMSSSGLQTCQPALLGMEDLLEACENDDGWLMSMAEGDGWGAVR